MEFITKIFTFIMQAISSDTIRGTMIVVLVVAAVLVVGKIYSNYYKKPDFFKLLISLGLVQVVPLIAGIAVLVKQFDFLGFFYNLGIVETMVGVLLIVYGITVFFSWGIGLTIAQLCARLLFKNHNQFSGISNHLNLFRSIGNSGAVIVSVFLVIVTVSSGMVSMSLSKQEKEESYLESIELMIAVIEKVDAEVAETEIKQLLVAAHNQKPKTDVEELISSSNQIVMVYNLCFLLIFLMSNNVIILAIVMKERMKKLAKECPTSPTNENPVDKGFTDVIEKDTVEQGNSSKYVGPVDKVLPQAIVCDTTKQVNEFTAGKSESKKNLIQDSKDVPADKIEADESINRMVVNAVVFSSAVGIIYLYKKFK